MARLLDLGFRTAPRNATTVKPPPVVMPADVDELIASVAAAQSPDEGDDGEPSEGDGSGAGAGKTLRLVTSLASSPRPRARPDGSVGVSVAVDAMQGDIDGALADAAPVAAPMAALTPLEAVGAAATVGPDLRPLEGSGSLAAQVASGDDAAAVLPVQAATLPVREAPRFLTRASTDTRTLAPPDPVVVTRISTSGGHHWGVNLGHYSSRASAERVLLQTMLAESASLGDGLRKVAQRSGGYDANFVGLTREQADMACRRLQARAVQCFTMGP